MTPAEFALERPCLEEIEGFKWGVREQGVTYSAGEWEPLLRWEKAVLRGEEVPAPSRDRRTYKYQRGRKPVRIRERHL